MANETAPGPADAGDVESGAGPGAGQADRVGDHQTGQFDAGDFVVDHDVDPPEEVQPTTSA
jgi:hypothetical protein